MSARLFSRGTEERRKGGGGRGELQVGSAGVGKPEGGGKRSAGRRGEVRHDPVSRSRRGKERRPCRCLKLDRAIHSLLPSPSASPPRSRAETVRPREPLQCRATISAAHSLVVWRAALTFRSLPGVALVAALRFPYASAALAFVSLRRPPDGRRAPFSPPRVEIPS